MGCGAYVGDSINHAGDRRRTPGMNGLLSRWLIIERDGASFAGHANLPGLAVLHAFTA